MENEYHTLREEMLRKIDLHNQLIMFSITTSVAILAYAFSQENAYIFLMPFCVVIPVSLRVIYYRSAMVKIAAYIIVFIENEQDDLNWETRNNKIGKGINNDIVNRILKMNLNYDGLIMLTTCYIVYLIKYISQNDIYNFYFILNIVWPLPLVIIEYFISKKGNGIYKTKHYWIDEWEKIKLSELKKDNQDFNNIDYFLDEH